MTRALSTLCWPLVPALLAVPKAALLLAFLYFVAGGHMVLPLSTIIEVFHALV